MTQLHFDWLRSLLFAPFFLYFHRTLQAPIQDDLIVLFADAFSQRASRRFCLHKNFRTIWHCGKYWHLKSLREKLSFAIEAFNLALSSSAFFNMHLISAITVLTLSKLTRQRGKSLRKLSASFSSCKSSVAVHRDSICISNRNIT